MPIAKVNREHNSCGMRFGGLENEHNSYGMGFGGLENDHKSYGMGFGDLGNDHKSYGTLPILFFNRQLSSGIVIWKKFFITLANVIPFFIILLLNNLKREDMKRKNLVIIVIVFVLLGLNNLLSAQAPNWAWARSAGNSFDEGWSVATDANGNVYMAGFFGGPSLTFDTITLNNSGGTAIFIVKYDAIGNVLWANSSGGAFGNRGYCVATDANGNVFVTGYFYNPTISFGSFTLTNADNSGNTNDIFIVKYDSSGTVLWAKSAGGFSYDIGYSVSADVNGNVLMTGYFDSPTITFGTFTLINADNTGNSADFFIVKYDTNGNVLWAKRAGGTSTDEGFSVATDANGNAIVTGSFASPAITFGTFTLNNASGDEMFIVKYDASGTVLWAKNAGCNPSSIATDANGNVLVTGYYYTPTITFGTFTLTNAGIGNFFIVKYDANGNVVWAKGAGGSSNDFSYCIATDLSGNVFVSGMFQSPFINFNSDTLYSPSGSTDPMFLLKYNPAGTFLWAKALKSGGDDNNSVATDAFGNVFIGGDFEVNPFIFGPDTLHLIGGENLFIAKINATTGIQEITSKSGISIYPNPFTTTTNFTLQGTHHNPTLFFYNLLGQEVGAYCIGTNKQFTIQRNQLPSGMYFYKLIEDNKEVLGIGKFIICDF